MGITNFNSFIKKTYKTSIKKVQKRNYYHHIYFDVNHILHNIICKSNDEIDFKTKLFDYLDFFFLIFYPLKSVTFAIDGPSPYAKINLQRKRRSLHKNDEDFTKLNSIYLTPGTDFMLNITKLFDEYIETRNKNCKYRKINYTIFDTKTPDEGELKLLKTLHENGKNEDHKHLVVGNDADLIIICIANATIKNIEVCIKSSFNKYDIISIDKLLTEHIVMMNNHKKIDNKLCYDFVFLSILMGNDYLPKLYYTKFEKLWESYFNTYNKLNKNLIKSNFKINKTFIIEFMTNVINLLPKQFKKHNLDKYNEQFTKNYLEGLLWCTNMYATGVCPAYDYICTIPICPQDILHFFNTSELKIKVPTSDIKAIEYDIYPLLVMPKKAKNLIPKKYHKLMDFELNYLYKEEECEKCNKLKNKLSKLNKQFYQDKQNTELKNKIHKLNDKLNKRKSKYNFVFDIDSILNNIKTL